ncbi:MAG: hypothetical protein ABIE03_05150 [Patescibacteria group bacterium]|nr:hypothetical protein [Patescibacteria group bacterium]
MPEQGDLKAELEILQSAYSETLYRFAYTATLLSYPEFREAVLNWNEMLSTGTLWNQLSAQNRIYHINYEHQAGNPFMINLPWLISGCMLFRTVPVPI